MLNSPRKHNPIFNLVNSRLCDLPAPVNINNFWNFGSLLGLCLIIQIISGLFISIFYIPDISLAFKRIYHIDFNVNYGWLIHLIHANGASIFFICIYSHIARNIYYSSFALQETWNIGIILYLISIATAFLGYVLPWGQIRFWGATVITSLLSVIPWLGDPLVQWIWGGFAVDRPTLSRFYSLHFIFPFIIAFLTLIHVIFLHKTGRNNPLGLKSSFNKIPIHPFFTTKDLLGFFFFFLLFFFLCFFFPSLSSDPENFLIANPIATPLHIKPEWYFLWLYAILRSVPNKIGGVVLILFAILLLFFFSSIGLKHKISIRYYPITQFLFWTIIAIVFILSWIGGSPVLFPYEIIGKIFTFSYFSIIFLILTVS